MIGLLCQKEISKAESEVNRTNGDASKGETVGRNEVTHFTVCDWLVSETNV